MVTGLATFALLWLVAMVWIAADNNVLGVHFFFTHLGKEKAGGWPRRFYWKFGWRLAVLTGLQLGILASVVLFARSAFASDSLGGQLVGIAALALMVVAIVVQHPRFHPFFRWEKRRRARTACRQLADVVHQFEVCQSVEDFTDRAEYPTQKGWLACHPRGASPWWPGVVPVAYFRRDGQTCVMFPVDWETFVAWQLPSDFSGPGEDLPFEGPHGTTFRLKKTAPLRASAQWTLLYTVIDFGLLREIGDAA